MSYKRRINQLFFSNQIFAIKNKNDDADIWFVRFVKSYASDSWNVLKITFAWTKCIPLNDMFHVRIKKKTDKKFITVDIFLYRYWIKLIILYIFFYRVVQFIDYFILLFTYVRVFSFIVFYRYSITVKFSKFIQRFVR